MTYKINARHLILDLLYASPDTTTSIKRILCAAQILGISENGVRVAVTRLNQDNVIQTVGRGMYQLVEKKFDTTGISLNKTRNMHLSDHWNGQFILVYTGHLGRIDRTALAKREKALAYYGLKELEQNLFIRPDNLGLDFIEFKKNITQFGLDTEVHFFRVNQLENEEQIQQLWDIDDLNQKYYEMIQNIEQWFARADQLDLKDAAISALHIGKKGIFLLRSDPLLPEEWANVKIRKDCEIIVQKMEKKGQELWQKIFAEHQV